MSSKHKVFVSYHHALDENYKNIFELRFGNAFGAIVPGSVQVGDISPNLPTDTIRQKIRDEYLRDTSVTVVLIGEETWQRKHVDWEIGSSIRHTEYNPRSGLLGILLPSYPRIDKSKYNHRTLPPRLHDNIKCGFASIHNWSEDAATVQGWIHEAYLRKSRVNPDNSRDFFGKNRTGSEWTD
ncbi:TIR domain-containing protein [Corallococcus caeni]|uniref:TIR domain-containing protein n=1 Tax=Corallococcus caeni TaxID=3082388 RepID=UPI0029560897|nr:TIR domain-containing protein [Corallococcus sp. KH5-1]